MNQQAQQPNGFYSVNGMRMVTIDNVLVWLLSNGQEELSIKFSKIAEAAFISMLKNVVAEESKKVQPPTPTITGDGVEAIDPTAKTE